MPLSIKDPEADRLAREVARITGETITQAVVTSLRDRLAREQQARSRNIDAVLEEARAIADHFASLPVLDNRSENEILGYDENGLPT
jgi:antitoxin VapB